MRVGIYNRWLLTGGGGERHMLALAECLSREHSVELLTLGNVDLAILASQSVDLSRVNLCPLPDWPEPQLAPLTAGYDLFVNASHGSCLPSHTRRSLMLVYFPTVPDRSPMGRLRRCIGLALRAALQASEPGGARRQLYRLLFERLLPQWGLRLQGIPATLDLSHLDTYDLICANSQFTRHWIQRYWQRDSEVLYPPVAVEAIRPLNKGKQILSVGRFVTGVTDKKHIVMIQAFRQLVEQGLTGWSLHLAGETRPEPVHQAYLRRVRAQAAGYPIHFHLDVPCDALARLYGESAIYWHASGYGQDVEREPIRFEHFGITTVEAMAAGCVPVVIGMAGPAEVVRHGIDGFLWHTLDELLRYTTGLIADEGRRREMGHRATERSRTFDRKAFERRLTEILDRLGTG